MASAALPSYEEARRQFIHPVVVGLQCYSRVRIFLIGILVAYTIATTINASVALGISPAAWLPNLLSYFGIAATAVCIEVYEWRCIRDAQTWFSHLHDWMAQKPAISV